MISRIPATSLALVAGLSAAAGASGHRGELVWPGAAARTGGRDISFERANELAAGAEDRAIWELLAERRTGQGRRGTRLPAGAGGGYSREPERARDRSIHTPFPLNGKTSH